MVPATIEARMFGAGGIFATDATSQSRTNGITVESDW